MIYVHIPQINRVSVSSLQAQMQDSLVIVNRTLLLIKLSLIMSRQIYNLTEVQHESGPSNPANGPPNATSGPPNPTSGPPNPTSGPPNPASGLPLIVITKPLTINYRLI
ncbi:unnamed protein product [Brugia pahangi]|uniref:Uncharacterized protein n=1 Tax=Brugia pahangi TaxID=6280 RepID=A0A0N4SXU4_BRUPA|nr:unnamed protein product [Brugia pahangi]